MPTQLQLRRGTTAQTAIFTGASGEITIDTDKNTVVVHDGSTQGGFPLLTSAQIENISDRANGAFSLANGTAGVANTDVTNISTTAAHHGSASAVAAFRVEANGRISSANSTSIAIDASAITSGALPIARGGTNGTSFTTGNLVFFDGTSLVSIANSGVTAATYGGAANSVSITVDAYGRVTEVSNIASSGGGTDFAFFMGSVGLI